MSSLMGRSIAQSLENPESIRPNGGTRLCTTVRVMFHIASADLNRSQELSAHGIKRVSKGNIGVLVLRPCGHQFVTGNRDV